jgi:hypothetical protein
MPHQKTGNREGIYDGSGIPSSDDSIKVIRSSFNTNPLGLACTQANPVAAKQGEPREMMRRSWICAALPVHAALAVASGPFSPAVLR